MSDLVEKSLLSYLPNCSVDEAYVLAEKLRKEIEISILPTNKKITISAGVGEYKANKETVSELLNRVDEALYVAKSEGRNKTIISPLKKEVFLANMAEKLLFYLFFFITYKIPSTINPITKPNEVKMNKDRIPTKITKFFCSCKK